MTKLSVGDLITVRSPNQSTELYMAVYKPPTVFSTQIFNGTVGKGSTTLPYISGITGNYLNVKSGMTAYIGTTSGGTDVGRIRVKRITNSSLTVAPDDNITYITGMFVTVKDFHELWSVYPDITVDANNNITFYKDGTDIVYSDQNTNLNPVPILGGNYAGFVDSSGTGTVFFVATGSYMPDGTAISSYRWSFPTGCSVTTVTSGVAGNINFPSPGFYTVQLDVVGADNKTGTAYRHVSLYNRPGTGPTVPFFDWTLNSLSGDWDNGWTASITVERRANEINDGDLVILFADDYFNNVRASYGGYYNREHIVFAGYVNKIENDKDFMPAGHSKITLRGTSNLLKNKEMFSVSLEDSTNPTDWTMLKNMTIDKIFNHYLRWHTTLLEIADVLHVISTEGTTPDQYEDIRKGEILNTVNGVLRRIFAQLQSDKQGRCFAEVDINLMPTGTRPATEYTFASGDWIDKLSFQEIMDVPTSMVTIGGMAYDLTTHSGTALLSIAPGDDIGYTGKAENISGLAITDQSQINILAGLYYSQRNNRTPVLSLELANNMRNIDVIPQEVYGFTLTGLDSYRGTIWNNKRFIPRKISYKYKKDRLVQSVDFEAETSGNGGDTVIIPVDPPNNQLFNTNISLFPTDTPAYSTAPISSGTLVFALVGNSKIVRTNNFGSGASTIWTDITGTVTGTPLVFRLDPFDPRNKAIVMSTAGIWYSVNIRDAVPTWTQSLSLATMQTAVGSGAGTFDLTESQTGTQATYSGAMQMTIASDGFIGIMARGANIFAGNYWAWWYGYTTNYRSGVWTFKLIVSNTGLRSSSSTAIGFALSQNTPNKVFTCPGGLNVGDTVLYYSTDGGTTWSNVNIATWGGSNQAAVFVPPANNPNDLIIFLGNSEGPGSALPSVHKTTTGPTGFSNISPTRTEGGKTIRYGPIWLDGFTESPSNPGGTGLYLAAHRARGSIIDPIVDGSALLKYDGSTWTWLHTETTGTHIWQGPSLGGWPYNNDRLQMYATDAGGQVALSLDDGVTWSDQTGNLASISAGIVKYIVPVWIGY